jgi:hypothetical protein
MPTSSKTGPQGISSYHRGGSRSRSRITNDPLRTRAPGRSARSRRLRDLYTGFAAKIGPDDIVGRAAALRAAELTATAEDIRQGIRAIDVSKASPELLKQLRDLANELVRIENLTDRAERRLRQAAQTTSKGPTLSDYLREEEEALAQEEARNGRR